MAVTINGTGPGNWDSSGNLGVGTASPSSYANYTTLTVSGTDADIDLLRGGTRQFGLYTTSTLTAVNNLANLPLYFYTNNTSRMILDTSGNLQFNSGYGSVATAYGCRAWVNFNGTTASPSTIRASGGVTSVTKNGTGDYTVNFSFTMPDANYVWTGSSQQTGSSINTWLCGDPNGTAPTTTAIRFKVAQGNFTNVDVTYVDIAVFR